MFHRRQVTWKWVETLLFFMLLRLPDTTASELSQISSSAVKLDQLFRSEQRLVQTLETYIQATEHALEQANRYVAGKHGRQVKPCSNGASSNMTTKRLQGASEENANRTAPSLSSLLSDIDGQLGRFVFSNGSGVGKREAIETISALIAVQSVYLLNVSDLADGRLMGRQTGTKLSTADINKVASISINSRAFKAGLTWYEEGAEIARGRQQEQWTAVMRLRLKEVREQHDQLLAEGATGYDLFPVAIGNRSASQLRQQLETNPAISNDMTWTNGPLCRGQDLRNASVTSKLFCALERRDWFWYLQPLKVEVVSLDPYICVFHDFLRKSMTDKIKQLSLPKMRRSLVRLESNSKEPIDGRVSSSTGLNDTDHPLVASLSHRVQLATGLHTTNQTGFPSEGLQVSEYGTGGYFTWHNDCFDLHKEDIRKGYLKKDPAQLLLGDRVATLMIYLGSPVLLGGRTIFPRLGLTLEPEPGAAVYWDNMLPDGRGDLRTIHAGCPVAYGYKWIANKFIRETAQIFRRPCQKISRSKQG